MTSERGVSRRALLIGAASAVGVAGAGLLGVESGTLPGRSRLSALFGATSSAGALPDTHPGLLARGDFVSQHRLGARCGYAIAYPGPTAERLPVVIVLHGKGADHRYAFGAHLGLDRYLAAAGHRFALASVDGGDTYWHRRASGEDAGAMVLEELLPILASHGLDTDRLGFLGWSMGGFGGIWLSSRLGPSRVAGVAAESPAIWRRAGDSAPGAFDDEQDFAAHDVFTHPTWGGSIPLRIDCGTEDGFYPAARDYAAALRPSPLGAFTPGGHNLAYWRGRAPLQLSFLARQFQ